VPLLDRHWVELGAALRCIHDTPLPPTLARRLPRERYPGRWRRAVRELLARPQDDGADAVARGLGAVLAARRDEIAALVARTERLALALRALRLPRVLCHGDLHAGNVLINSAGGIYITDWDAPIRAPRERDLMYAGGGQFCNRLTPAEEETLFYRGYGDVCPNAVALAYYRYERIVEDIAQFAESILRPGEGHEDRAQCLRYLEANFLPGGVLEIARAADRAGEVG